MILLYQNIFFSFLKSRIQKIFMMQEERKENNFYFFRQLRDNNGQFQWQCQSRHYIAWHRIFSPSITSAPLASHSSTSHHSHQQGSFCFRATTWLQHSQGVSKMRTKKLTKPQKNLSKIEKRTETPLTGKRHLHKIII